MKISLVLLIAWLMALNSDGASAEVVAVVSAQSTITALSPTEIADIFLGKRARLPGGGTAVPIDQAEDSPEREEFYVRYAGRTPVEMKMHWSKLIFTGRGQPPRQVRDAEAVKAALAAQPNAIGYLDRRYVDESLTVLE
ncbi:MAG TPA: phosphate ABC transporter substrate-binding protein [Pseudomonadales bacterium]